MSAVTRRFGLATLAGLALATGSAHAAITPVSYTGGTYTEGFDSLTGALNTAVPLTNGTTVPGLYTYISGRSTYATAGPIDTIYRSNGYATTVGTATSTYTATGVYGLYANAASATASPSLGFFNSDSNTTSGSGYIAAGLIFTNSTNDTITSFTLDYNFATSTGTTTAADGLAVSYAINPTGSSVVGNLSGTFVAAPNLNTTVNTDATVTGPTSDVVSGFTLNPGDTIAIRFVDTNVSGTDRFMRVDNVAVTLPEPASLAAVAMAGVGLLRRRRPTA